MFISFDSDPQLMPLSLRRRAWLHAREDAREAYRAWAEAEDAEKADAFVVYRAAEQREAAAARALAATPAA